jgi:hypothetical protein
MRDPALHIKRSNLILVMNQLKLDVTQINDLMRLALRYSIRNRVFVTTKAIGKKKSDRFIASDTGLLEQFNRIYMGVMLNNHIKVIPITKANPQHLTLKEVCWQAGEFCKLFSLDFEVGFKTYIELGLKILNKRFSIYRLKGASQRIVEYHQEMQMIQNDITPKDTDNMVVAYTTAIKHFYSTNIEIDNNNNSTQRAHFIYMKEVADKANADYFDWVFAHFERYLYLNSIPSFSQLYSDQSILIYKTYMAKVGKKTSETERNYFNKLSNVKKTDIPTKKDQQKESLKKTRLLQSAAGAGQTNNGE